MSIILSGLVCMCLHTHVYEGTQYIDCPYCPCREHTRVKTDKIYNKKRYNAWINKHEKRPKRIKQDRITDVEIDQMINSLRLI